MDCTAKREPRHGLRGNPPIITHQLTTSLSSIVGRPMYQSVMGLNNDFPRINTIQQTRHTAEIMTRQPGEPQHGEAGGKTGEREAIDSCQLVVGVQVEKEDIRTGLKSST